MTIVSIIVGILIFSLLVISHEFGHYIMARIFGIGVAEFSIGMGPVIFKKQGKKTRFSLKAIPFGGSCRMVDEDAAGGGEISLRDLKDEEDNQEENDYEENNYIDPITEVEFSPEESFRAKSVWARICVVIGGPIFNVIFALLLAFIMVLASGTNPPIVYNVSDNLGAKQAGIQVGDEIISINGSHLSVGREIELLLSVNELGDQVTITYERDGEKNTVSYSPNYEIYVLGISYYNTEEPAALGAVAEGGSAYNAGLTAGDVITQIDGEAISSGREFGEYCREHPLSDKAISITYERGGAVYETELVPTLASGKSLGFSASYFGEDADISNIFPATLKEVVYAIKTVIYSLKMIFNGQVSLKDVSGPVGIVSVIGTTIEDSSEIGFLATAVNLLSLSVLLSVNLGIVNMFPFPALDGGRFLLLLIEAITKKKLPKKAEAMVNMIGFCVLMLLMVVILVSDVTKLFG